jgi:NAD-specific glutamate dehydrogenase
MKSGFDLEGAWEQINDLDNQIENQVTYAFHEDMGYLAISTKSATRSHSANRKRNSSIKLAMWFPWSSTTNARLASF